ncbi:ankyrin repeat and SAM domain-containing protein 4B-like [Rhipicephalus sanguineus]|uniref:ankyrin repeat and SAM domain-containing protein 4B-like n=1 Tax=Rhipicephalus sanguineus TaxID=34632 RepID=UPI00189330C2|nr:ankyrin repeat and SAM domain-containing protein 4B-like [Rhipicephalus sanguineus]
MFERPGSGCVAFLNSILGSLLSLPSCPIDDDETGSIALPCGSVVDSIGSTGSLAQRPSVLPWEDVYYEEDEEDEEEDGSGTPPVIVVFLSAHGLAEYAYLFSREKVDLDALTLSGEEGFMNMGVQLGPHNMLLRTVRLRRVTFQDPGEVADTRL